MQSRIIKTSLIAVALLMSANMSLAAVEAKPAAAVETKSTGAAKTPDAKSMKPVPKKAKRINPVDINSASKAELMKLPGINDEAAGKIIAGRPYLSKADLITQNTLSSGSYEEIKAMVIAKQNKASAAKLEEMKKATAKKKN